MNIAFPDIPNIYRAGRLERFKLFFDSPNEAGWFLLTLLIAASFYLIHVGKEKCSAIVVKAFAITLLVALVLTFSRGAYFALAVLCIIYCRIRFNNCSILKKGNFRTSVLFLILIFLLVAYSPIGLALRISPSLIVQDESVLNRLSLWSAGLAMISLKPLHGWGSGASGYYFGQLFQSIDNQESYQELVNGWLTIWVEFGLIQFYLTMTVVFFPVVFFLKKFKGSSPSNGRSGALAFSIISFILCNTFSVLHEDLRIQLWIVMILAFAYWHMIRDIGKTIFASSFGVTTALVLSISFLIYFTGNVFKLNYKIACEDNLVWIQSAGYCDERRASTVLLVADSSVLGENYGRELRKICETSAGNIRVAICGFRDDLPNPRLFDLVILTGRASEKMRGVSAVNVIELYPSSLDFSRNVERERYFFKFSDSITKKLVVQDYTLLNNRARHYLTVDYIPMRIIQNLLDRLK